MIIQINNSKELAKALWIIYKQSDDHDWFCQMILAHLKDGKQFTTTPFKHLQKKIDEFMETYTGNDPKQVNKCVDFDRQAFHLLESIKISRHKWPMFLEVFFFGDVATTISRITLYTHIDVNKYHKFKDLYKFLKYHYD